MWLRIQPSLEEGIQAREHLFFDTANVCQTGPAGQIGVFASALELDDKLLHQSATVTVLFPEMLLAGLRRLSLPVLGAECHRGRQRTLSAGASSTPPREAAPRERRNRLSGLNIHLASIANCRNLFSD